MIKHSIRKIRQSLPWVGPLYQTIDRLKAESLKNQTAFPIGHFYSPVPNKQEILDKLPSLAPSPTDISGIDLNDDVQLTYLSAIKPFYQELPFTDQPKAGYRYYYENEAYSYADAITLYGMLRSITPKQVIEVGSGFSSALMLDTNEYFFERPIHFTFIEPYPDRLYGLLKDNDRTTVNIVPQGVQDVPLALFEALDVNDILLIDSTHVCKAFSDVNHLIFNVLPCLKPGVLIHFHDIFPGFEYPADWLKRGIFWNEAYLLRAFLQYNAAFEIIFFTPYLCQVYPHHFTERMPLYLKNTGGSLWLKKRL